MKTPTLVAKYFYFGLEAMRLREGSGRILDKIQGRAGGAAVGLKTLTREFGLDPASPATVDQMLEFGLLERRDPERNLYSVTDRFRQYAHARIIKPLPRSQARLLLAHLGILTERFNRRNAHNRYTIAALAVFDGYMSLDEELAELSIGVVRRRRVPKAPPSSGRATKQTDGTEAIRALLEGTSEFVRVTFFAHLRDVPRPFSVTYEEER